MVSIGLKKTLSKKELPGLTTQFRYDLNTEQGRTKWELENFNFLEKILTRWHNAVHILSNSQVFTDGVYEYFSNKTSSRKGLAPIKLKEILLFIKNKYKNYLRIDISEEDLKIIFEFESELQKGIRIGFNTIFPVLYYPYMEKQYYDHANWNKVPEAISISDVLYRKDKYVIKHLTKIDINPFSKSKMSSENESCSCKEGKKCGSSECNCNRISNNDSTLNRGSGNLILTLEKFAPYNQKPILFVGYGDTSGYNGNIMVAKCYCQVKICGTVSYCSTDGTGQFCSSWIPCPKVDCPSKGFDNCNT